MIIKANKDNSPEFDQYAPSYSELLNDPIRDGFARDPLHFHRRKWALIEKLLRRTNADLPTMKWLDVGCGRGELLQMAGPNFKQAMGCDPSTKMLSLNASFEMHKQSSLVELPFEDNSVDFVTAVCVYHHIHGEARTLLAKEIRRVLVPDGLCCIVEHNPWNPITQAIVKRCPVDIDADLLTGTGTNKLFLNAGFKFVELNFFLYFPEWLYSKAALFERVFYKLPLGGQYALLIRAPR